MSEEAKFVVGQPVQVLAGGSGSIPWPAIVVEVKGDKVKIRWDGRAVPEWVDRHRVFVPTARRRSAAAAAQPIAETEPAKKKAKASGGALGNSDVAQGSNSAQSSTKSATSAAPAASAPGATVDAIATVSKEPEYKRFGILHGEGHFAPALPLAFFEAAKPYLTAMNPDGPVIKFITLALIKRFITRQKADSFEAAAVLLLGLVPPQLPVATPGIRNEKMQNVVVSTAAMRHVASIACEIENKCRSNNPADSVPDDVLLGELWGTVLDVAVLGAWHATLLGAYRHSQIAPYSHMEQMLRAHVDRILPPPGRGALTNATAGNTVTVDTVTATAEQRAGKMHLRTEPTPGFTSGVYVVRSPTHSCDSLRARSVGSINAIACIQCNSRAALLQLTTELATWSAETAAKAGVSELDAVLQLVAATVVGAKNEAMRLLEQYIVVLRPAHDDRILYNVDDVKCQVSRMLTAS